MAWYSSILNTGSQAFSWLGNNPGAANFLGGAALAGLQYMQSNRDLKARKQEAQDERGSRMIEASTGRDKYGEQADRDMAILPQAGDVEELPVIGRATRREV